MAETVLKTIKVGGDDHRHLIPNPVQQGLYTLRSIGIEAAMEQDIEEGKFKLSHHLHS